MADQKAPTHSYHYDYAALDKFLDNDYDPEQLGDQFDELMSDLVNVSRDEADFGHTLSNYHFMLRRLRDIFWGLQQRQKLKA